jgi:hypothetical protein
MTLENRCLASARQFRRRHETVHLAQMKVGMLSNTVWKSDAKHACRGDAFRRGVARRRHI